MHIHLLQLAIAVTAPGGRYKNQIDHMLVQNKWNQWRMDILVKAKIRIKLSKNKKNDLWKKRVNFNVESLQKESTRDKFSAEFKTNWPAAGEQSYNSRSTLKFSKRLANKGCKRYNRN
jgi:hypothetical protein